MQQIDERYETNLQGRRVPPAQADKSIPELIKGLADETNQLVRQELDLLRVEMTEKGKRAGLGVGMITGGGIAAFFALACLTTTVIALLALELPVWLAALLVTIVWGVAAVVLALNGKQRVQAALPPTPEQTIATVKEDAQWAKTRAESGRR